MKQQFENTMFNQGGFSLIEALVAFLILSIGLLGIASLQMLSLKAGKTAEFRTVAVLKSEEIMERIRNNPEALDTAKSTVGYISSVTDFGQSFSCNDYGALTYCTIGKMARDDIFQWKESWKNSLPNNAKTTASIAVVAATPGVLPTATVTVTINWEERNTETKTMDVMSYSTSSHICNHTGC